MFIVRWPIVSYSFLSSVKYLTSPFSTSWLMANRFFLVLGESPIESVSYVRKLACCGKEIEIACVCNVLPVYVIKKAK